MIESVAQSCDATGLTGVIALGRNGRVERGRSQRSIDELTAAVERGVFHVYKFVFFAGEIKTSFRVRFRTVLPAFELLWKVAEIQCHARLGFRDRLAWSQGSIAGSFIRKRERHANTRQRFVRHHGTGVVDAVEPIVCACVRRQQRNSGQSVRMLAWHG